jgi:hypothetical protein
MLVIVAVDFRLGAVADSLNAYEIVRRTFCRKLPCVSQRFVVGQDVLGGWALPVAWAVWLVEAGLALLVLRTTWWAVIGVIRTFR